MKDPRPLIAVDPGIRGCGVAVFDSYGVLWRADYVKNLNPEGNRSQARHDMVHEILGFVERATFMQAHEFGLCYEFMKVYSRTDSRKGDQNDLTPLCALVDRLAGTLGEVGHDYLPQEWKGQLDKETCKARVISRLTPEELSRVGKAGPKLDTWDAIGIGLHHLGRLAPKKVYPR